MHYFSIFATVSILAYLAHDWGEKFATKNHTKDFDLIVKGYHIHHSFFGLLALPIAFLMSKFGLTVAFLGYSLGNIWQHKRAHNKQNERGMVFIERVKVKAQ